MHSQSQHWHQTFCLYSGIALQVEAAQIFDKNSGSRHLDRMGYRAVPLQRTCANSQNDAWYLHLR